MLSFWSLYRNRGTVGRLASLWTALWFAQGCGAALVSQGGPGAGPPPIAGPQLAAGKGQSCLLAADGALRCWGRLANDTPRGGHFHALALGPGGGCAAGDAGSVCWGPLGKRLGPPPEVRLSRLAVGADFACAIRDDDSSVNCWGSNESLVAGVPSGPHEALAAGRSHACALDRQGRINCWGDNRRGQLDAPEGPFRAVGAGGQHSCGILDAGYLRCWGDDRAGQTRTPDGEFVALDLGLQHSCAMQAQGIMRCWGENSDRQATPPNGRHYLLAVGDVHGCAIGHPDGAIRCWGSDFNGEASPPRGASRIAVPQDASTAHRRPRRDRRRPADDGAALGKGGAVGGSAAPAPAMQGVSFGKVVVLGLRSDDGDDDEARILSGGLREASGRMAGYAVGDESVSADQMALAQGCEGFDEACMARIAKQLGAAALVYGTLRRVRPGSAARLLVELRMFESLAGKVSATTTGVISGRALRKHTEHKALQLLRQLDEASRN